MAQGAVLGLDIGTRVIKLCEIGPGKQGPELLAWGVAPTPQNVISNGVIVDPPALAGAITQLIASAGAKSRKVHCSVASQSSLVVRPIEVPRMSEAELVETMRWEVERYIPFAASEVIVDYKPLVAVEQLPESQQNMDVLLAAGQEDMINAYVEALTQAKLEILSLDVEPLASGRALIDINADRGAYEQVIALVNIGAGTTDISIYKRGVLSFCRPVALAGDSLTNAISENLGREFAEAERLKTEEGMILFDASLYRTAIEAGSEREAENERIELAPPPEGETSSEGPVFDLGDEENEAAAAASGEPAAFDLGGGETPAPPPVPTAQNVGDTMGRRVFESMAPTLAELVTEVRRSLDFFSTRGSQTRVDKVFVFGGTARLPHFERFLTNELGTEVEIGNPLARLDIATPDGYSEELKSFSPMLPIAVGMGIRDLME